jgi:hypothetical protein
VEGEDWARIGEAVKNKASITTADIAGIITDLEALVKRPRAFDPVRLRLKFERDENRDESLDEGLDGLAEKFIVVSFVFIFYLCLFMLVGFPEF